jgi:hypothetical protein
MKSGTKMLYRYFKEVQLPASLKAMDELLDDLRKRNRRFYRKRRTRSMKGK